MKVAVAKYAIQQPRDFAAFAERLSRLLADAHAAGARVAVLPEYLSLELAATFPDAVSADLPASLAATQALRADWCALFERLAREHDLHIIAGSFRWRWAKIATATAATGSRPLAATAGRTSCN